MSEEQAYEGIASRAQERGNPSFVWRKGQERRLALIKRHVPLEGKQVLDAGCGIGMYVAAFQHEGAIACGLEIERERALEAAKVSPRTVVGSVQALPFPDDTFDIVFSHEVIEHVADDAEAMREMARAVRPGGYVVVYAPNRWYPFETHGIEWRGRYHFGNFPLINYLPHSWRNRLCPHARAYTRRQIRRLFENTPLQIRVHTQIYPGFDNIVGRWPRLGRFVRMVMHALENTPLRFFGLSHFVVARRIVPGD